jgi:Domain of unknown function (DUF4136)
MRAIALRLATAAGVAALLLAGCETGPDVRGEFDKTVDFGKYKTFNFVSQTNTAGGGDYKSLAMRTLQDAGATQMKNRGYTMADNADLLINFRGKIDEKTDVESTPAPMYGPSWGYHGWYGAPYGAYGYGGSEVTTRHYKVGQLVMDVVDREKRQVVFQGGYQVEVTKKMMENREQALNDAVAAIFAKYPFQAGVSAPAATPAAQ